MGVSLTLFLLTALAILAAFVAYMSETYAYISMISLIGAVLLTGGCLATLLERIYWELAKTSSTSKEV